MITVYVQLTSRRRKERITIDPMWNEWVRWFSIWSCLSKRLLAALRCLMFANGCLKIPIVMCSSLELPGIGEESPVMLSDFVKILSRLMFSLIELSRMSFRCDANLSLMSCRSSTVEFKKGRFSFSNGVRVPLSSFQLVRVSVKRLKKHNYQVTAHKYFARFLNELLWWRKKTILGHLDLYSEDWLRYK